MTKRSRLLDRIYIAAPCPASWSAMDGSDKVRFCKQCNLNVYNFSTMSTAEAEHLILEKEGKLCARIFRRKDGTIMTENCPVGLRWLRDRLRVASMFFGLLVSWFLSTCRGQGQELQVSLEEPGIFSGTGGVMEMHYPNVQADEIDGLVTPWSDYGCKVSESLPRKLVLRRNNNSEYRCKEAWGIFADKIPNRLD